MRSGRDTRWLSESNQRPQTAAVLFATVTVLLFFGYSLPLFWPPAGSFAEWDAGAPFLARLFPGVPSWWTGFRLLALTLCVIALARWGPCTTPFPCRPHPPLLPVLPWQRRVAVSFSALLLLAAPWVRYAGPLAQLVFLLGVFVPALSLWSPFSEARLSSQGKVFSLNASLPVVAIVVVWVAIFLAVEIGGLEATRAVDQWRAFVDALHFVARGGNLLAERYDPELPNLGALPFVFQGIPFWQVGLVEPSLASVQLVQMITVAMTAAGLAVLATWIIGPGPAIFATAGFLFSPFTHLMAVTPAPYLFGPAVTVALLLAALRFLQLGSHAGLAAAAPLAAYGLLYPGVVPVVALAGVFVLARWPATRHTHSAAWLAGTITFAAALLPAIPKVFSLAEAKHLIGFHGLATVIDRVLLGQASVLLMEEARAFDVRRSFDIVAGALLAPFAHARLHIRLWTDALFDPLTAALFAFGLVLCLRNARQHQEARSLLALLLAALSPAFLSPVERVDIVHAVSLAVPVALIAATGLSGILKRLPSHKRARTIAIATLFGSASGFWLSHVVPTHVLSGSSTGIALESVAAADATRAVVVDYPARFHPDVRWLYVGPMTAYGSQIPIGYLRLEGQGLPVDQLVADGRDLVFWSPGLERDFSLRASLCERRPAPALFQIWDHARLGSVWAARVGPTPWEPQLDRQRWRAVSCR